MTESSWPAAYRGPALLFSIVLAGAVMLSPAPAIAGDAASPIGTWLTEKGGADVKIATCDVGKLCGSIVWIKQPLDAHGQPKVDSKNPDESLRSRKILGLPILTGFVSSGDGSVWKDGFIYNPDDGKTYRCTLTVVDDHTLRVRGYVGISLFGKTQVWTRVDGVSAPAGAQ
jgi:uncharacterized protein (DUF2147 family)